MKKLAAGLSGACLAATFIFSGCLVFVRNELSFGGGLREKTVLGEGKDKILLVSVSGLIHAGEDGGLLGPGGTTPRQIVEQLQLASEDERVKAILLRIESPGGSVSASDQIYKELLRAMREKKLRVAALFSGLGASGAFYVAQAAERVYATPASIVGNVGVIIPKLNAERLLVKLGLENEVLKSGPKKDMGSPLRGLSPEERALLQRLIADYYKEFVALIFKARPGLDRKQLQPYLDGRILAAKEAAQLGLIDGVLEPEDALERLKKDFGLEDARLVIYQSGGGRPNIYSDSGRGGFFSKSDIAPAAGATLVSAAALRNLLSVSPALPLYLWTGN